MKKFRQDIFTKHRCDNFWNQVNKNNGSPSNNPCWNWDGKWSDVIWYESHDLKYRSIFSVIKIARRIAFEITNSVDISGYTAYPNCGNEKCISPFHTTLFKRIGGLLDRETVANFWCHVDKSPGFGPSGDCWRWIGVRTRLGYGQMVYRDYTDTDVPHKTLTRGAHRVSFLIEHGYLPNLDICHSCDNPPCVNPNHLWAGTKKENMKDRDSKGRNGYSERTHCKNNHLFPENPPRNSWGARICRICINEGKRRRRKALKERIDNNRP